MGWEGRKVRRVSKKNEENQSKNVHQKRVILRKTERGILMKLRT
jgi:hypothetical protein